MDKEVVGITMVCALLCMLQIGLGLYSLFKPNWLVGNLTLATVETFQNPIDPNRLEDRFIPVTINGTNETQGILAPVVVDPAQLNTSEIYVDAAIGILETLVNGRTNKENREGLKSVVGFIMISLVASTLSLMYCISILISECCGASCRRCEGCCKKCRTCLKFLARKLKDIAKANYAAGISAGVSDAMFAFTAEDLTTTQFGSSFYVLIGSALASIISGMLSVQCKEKLEQENENGRHAHGT
uniref:Uncharacterized protein n=1 Tax=Ciona savignyi TaxID=51511 RepID=H2Z771_CIOSA